MKKQSLLKETTLFSASLFASRLLLSVRGILIPKFLGPSQYGIYNGLLIIPDFLLHFHFGSLSALKREIPFCYGKGDLAQAQKIRNIVFFEYLGTTLISILFLFSYSFFISKSYSPLMIIGLRLVCLLILFQTVEEFFENLLRTDNRFDILSKSEIFKSVIGFFILILLIWLWELPGLILSLIIASFLKGGYIYQKTRYQFQWIWDFDELKRLLRIGFPIISGVILYAFLASVDRFVIIKYLDSTQLGYYAMGLTVLKFLQIIQVGAYGVLEPKVYKLYGEKKDVSGLTKLVWEPIYAMSLFFPLIIGLSLFAVPYVINLFLPKYLSSLPCIRIMILSSFFFIFQNGTYAFMIALNRQRLIVWIVSIGTLICLISNYILVHRGWGIEGVALGTMGSNILIGLVFLLYTLHSFSQGFKKKIILLGKLFSSFFLTVIYLMMLDYGWPIHKGTELSIVLLKSFILIMLLSPFLWKIKKWLKGAEDSQMSKP